MATFAVVVDHEDEGLVGGEQAPALAQGLEVLDLAGEVGGDGHLGFGGLGGAVDERGEEQGG